MYDFINTNEKLTELIQEINSFLDFIYGLNIANEPKNNSENIQNNTEKKNNNEENIKKISNTVVINQQIYPYICIDTEFFIKGNIEKEISTLSNQECKSKLKDEDKQEEKKNKKNEFNKLICDDKSDSNYILCLIQILFQGKIYIIDPLYVDISLFNSILQNDKLLKVFHGCYNDLIILKNNNITVNNIYDTQLCEGFLSIVHQISFESFVYKYLKKKVSKKYQISNWLKRPLSKKQLQYAVNDVFLLNKGFLLQYNKLIKNNRLEISYQECKDVFDKFLINKNEDIDDLNKDLNDEFLQEDSSKFDVNDNLKNEITKNNIDVNSHDSLLLFLKFLLFFISKKERICPQFIASSDDLKNFMQNKHNKCLKGWRLNIFGKLVQDFLNGKNSISLENVKSFKLNSKELKKNK